MIVRFQNRRTKWKKTENISNTEAAEHKLGTRKMSSTSSSSSLLDHNMKQVVQLPIDGSTSSKSSSCSSTSSRRSNGQIYNTSLPLLYFNPFTHLLQTSSTVNEGSCSISPSTSSSLPQHENYHCSSSRSTPLNNNHLDECKGNENMTLKCSNDLR